MSASSDSILRPDVLELLQRLRGRIRRYVALEGTALVVAILGAAFWISLTFDYWLELPQAARRVLLVLAAGATGTAAVWYLVLRLVRDFRHRSLALVLERRFPELNDRLITAVELADSREQGTTLTASMLERTAREAADLAHRLNLGEVFNIRPLARAAAVAGLLLASMIGFRVAFAETFHTWLRRNVLLADEFYRRDTELRVVILADPGERVVELKDGKYKHPRGSDLTFLAEVPEGKTVPSQVQFSFHNVGVSGGGSDYMTRVGQRQFRHKIAGLFDSIELKLRGGDFSTRTPYLIEVVEPPQIDTAVLECLYPEYTGLNPRDESSQAPVRQTVPIQGTEVAIPAGTDFLLRATFNKGQTSVRLQAETFDLMLNRGSAQLIPTGREAAGEAPRAIDLPAARTWLAADGRSVSVPLVLAVVPEPDVVSAEGTVTLPLRLPPNATLRLTLHDEDDVISAEPARILVSSIVDKSPQVEVRLKGIGTVITRQATIPVVGDMHDAQDGSKIYGVTDDYGIADAHFEYKLDGSDAFETAPFAGRPEGARQFPVDERFKVLPLDLSIGRRFTLKVTAADADNVAGPHVSSGTPWNFQIVSDDELLALVAVKELNIRRRFEQILEEVKNTRKDVQLHRTRLQEPRVPGDAPPAETGNERHEATAELENTVLNAVRRAISGIRKNANETASIEEEFRDIRDELENNAVPDAKPMLERIDEGIVKPLHSINTVDYNNVDDSLVLLERVLEEKGNPFARFDESVEQLNLTIEHLEAVLSQMLKLETVNEALQMLRDIIKAQEELQEKTREERKRKLIEGLQ